jgi:hypothetical protein
MTYEESIAKINEDFNYLFAQQAEK